MKRTTCGQIRLGNAKYAFLMENHKAHVKVFEKS